MKKKRGSKEDEIIVVGKIILVMMIIIILLYSALPYNRTNMMSIHTDLTSTESNLYSIFADSDYIYIRGDDGKIQVYYNTNGSLHTELEISLSSASDL